MLSESINRYNIPRHWIRYDAAALFNLLVEAKSAAALLRKMPYLHQWIEQAHEDQLRLEAEGTSRIVRCGVYPARTERGVGR